VFKAITRGAVVTALILGSVNAASAQVQVRDFPKPDKEIEDPFTLIAAAIEYVGGKLLVADGVETQLSLIDFATGAKTAIGRQGAGPGEYTGLIGLFRRPGDTIWVMDAQGPTAGRIVMFSPDKKAGPTFPFLIGMNLADSTTLSAPYYVDRQGTMYASTLPLKIATAAGASADSSRSNVGFADSLTLVKFDPKTLNAARTKIARLRFFSSSSGMKQQVVGTNVKLTMAHIGLSIADSWAMFSDGRIAIVRGSNYGIEFIKPDGTPGGKTTIAYEHFKLAESDKKLEMDAARELAKQRVPMIKKMLPPGWTIELELLSPPSWPAEYPPINPEGVRAAPDGRLWVQRAVPKRIDREQWDVIDASGKLVARWQLPPKVSVIAVGDGFVYTARTDEDDLKYVQRVTLPRCTECR
jgi:hypothetical protein